MSTAYTESLTSFLDKLKTSQDNLTHTEIQSADMKTKIDVLVTEISSAAQDPSSVTAEQWQDFFKRTEEITTITTRVVKHIR